MNANRPPLAKELFRRRGADSPFDEAVNLHPRCVPLVHELDLTARQGHAIEAALTQISARAVADPVLQAQVAAVRYYLRDVIKPVTDAWYAECNRRTNQMILANTLHQHFRTAGRPSVLVSFNYDRLFERGCEDALAFRLDQIGKYAADPGLKIFKPHGCVSWSREAVTVNNAPVTVDYEAELVEWSTRLHVTDNYAIEPTNRPREDWAKGQAWLPAIAVPTDTKGAFEAPQAHLAQMREAIGTAKSVLAIGWRAQEEHFLKCLMVHLPVDSSLMVVSESYGAGMETVDNLWRTCKFGRFSVFGSGFSAFCAPNVDGGNSALEDFLKGRTSWSVREPGAGGPPLEYPPNCCLGH